MSIRLFLAVVAVQLLLRATMMSADLGPKKADQNIRLRSYEVLKQFMRGNSTSALHEKCGFPAIAYAINNREHLSADVASALQIVLQRPITQKSILVGSFRVHYDTAGTDDVPAMLDSAYKKIPGTADQFADSVAAIANYCETFETKVLGYLPSPSDSLEGGGPEYDIYIASLGDYGFTTYETPIEYKPNGGTFTSFVTIDNAFQFVTPAINKGMPALRVTLAHELHHSIQIGNYGYWTNDIYYYEITSVWMEDVVFPDVKDYLQYVTSPEGHFSHPDVPFNTTSFIMYSRAIWAHYIAKRFGRDAMRRSWEEIQNAPPLQAIDEALSKPPYSSSFRSAFAEWSSWNYFTGSRADTVLYYPEGKAYSQINPLSALFSPPSSTVGGNLEELGSMYYNIISGTFTSPLMITNINLTAAYSGNLTSFPYAFTLSNNQLSVPFMQTGFGVFISFTATDQGNWYSTLLVGGSQLSKPFPDPFKPDGYHVISFPANSDAAATGILSIYSSDLSLVYSASLISRYSSLVAEQIFEWNGVTNKNSIANSGVYIYVLQTQNGMMKGKFALLRK